MPNPRKYREVVKRLRRYDQHNERIVAHFVQYAVVTNPKPAQAPHMAFQNIAEEGILRQPVNGRHDPRSIRLDDPRQFLGRAALNPYREAHV